MRILIFHGYLLSGTGSNVYNARLAEALVRSGHEVHLFSQDRHPERYPFLAAAGDWESGTLTVRLLPQGAEGTGADATRAREATAGGTRTEGMRAPGPASATAYRPDIGDLLPVYVQDRYEGIEAKTFAACSDAQIEAYVEANVRAVREVARRVRPELALANHLVMGPAILARALERTPYAVKVHGSALEYAVKPEPQRFLGYAREGLERARTILVGSRHTAESLWQAMGDPELERRTRFGPPGVDIARFAPRRVGEAKEALDALVQRLQSAAPTSPSVASPAPAQRGATSASHGSSPASHEASPSGWAEASSAFARDETAAAQALERIAAGSGPLVAFVGKLIVSKGVDLLIAAWPLVLGAVPDARLVVIGFGAYREGLERLLARLAAGDLAGSREIARAGRSLEGAPASEVVSLRYLLAFLDSLSGAELDVYRRAARRLSERVVFTGRLDHEELGDVLPACEALVVPSTFPEAFGMVAAEAAACGALPVSAGHSGLAEVSEALAAELPPQAARFLSFPVDDGAVRAIADRVVAWLRADDALRADARAALVSTVRERWSWEGVACGVIAAARGEG